MARSEICVTCVAHCHRGTSSGWAVLRLGGSRTREIHHRWNADLADTSLPIRCVANPPRTSDEAHQSALSASSCSTCLYAGHRLANLFPLCVRQDWHGSGSRNHPPRIGQTRQAEETVPRSLPHKRTCHAECAAPPHGCAEWACAHRL